MSNLIVTLFGILLAAIVIAAGIFYGGTVYNSYIVNIKANEIINDMQQIKTAVYAWRADNAETDSPLTDPTGQVTNCQGAQSPQNSIQNSLQACFVDALTNNGQYLSADMFQPTYTRLDGPLSGSSIDATINTHLSFGNYGACTTELSNGFNRCYIKITASNYPTTPYIWAVQWALYTTSYSSFAGATSGISQTQATYFAVQLCHKINQLLGQETSSGTYPNLPPQAAMNNYTIAGTSYPINLPYMVTAYPLNICFAYYNTATVTQFMLFIPI